MSYGRGFFGGLKYIAGATILAMGLLGAGSCIQHIDYPGFSEKTPSGGRTRNGVAALVAGATARTLHDSATIDMEVQKPWWPDAELTGHVTPSTVDTKVNVALSSAKFKGSLDDNGYLRGEVHKSEFNWHVQEREDGDYDLGRFMFKWNTKLRFKVWDDGKITGVYERSGPHWDWNLNGTYDPYGNVHIDVDVPWGFDFSLNGKITPN